MREPKVALPLTDVPPMSHGLGVQADELRPTDSSTNTPSNPSVGRLDVRAVFDAHFDFVWRSLRRLGVREADVDDALQEVFVVVHRKGSEFEGRSKITTWLYGICFRIASDYQRKAYIRREQPTDEIPEAAPDLALLQSAEVSVESAEARALLEEVLSALDVEKRAVFVLYEIEELPVEEIAERVGIPVGTVYSRLKTARGIFEKSVQRLKTRLAHDERRRGQ